MASVLPLLLALALLAPGLGDAVDSPTEPAPQPVPESTDPAQPSPQPEDPATEPTPPSEPTPPPSDPPSEPATSPDPAPTSSENPVCPEACETCCKNGVCTKDADSCTWVEGVPDWASVLVIVGGFLLVTMLVSWLLKACTAKANPEDDWLREQLLTDKIPSVRAGDPFKTA